MCLYMSLEDIFQWKSTHVPQRIRNVILDQLEDKIKNHLTLDSTDQSLN